MFQQHSPHSIATVLPSQLPSNWPSSTASPRQARSTSPTRVTELTESAFRKQVHNHHHGLFLRANSAKKCENIDPTLPGGLANERLARARSEFLAPGKNYGGQNNDGVFSLESTFKLINSTLDSTFKWGSTPKPDNIKINDDGEIDSSFQLENASKDYSNLDRTSKTEPGRRSASKSCSRLGVIKNSLKAPCSLRKQVKKWNRPVFSNFDVFENTVDDRNLRMCATDFKLAGQIAQNQRGARGRDVSPRRVITELLHKRGSGNFYRDRVSSGMLASAVTRRTHTCTHPKH